MNDYHFEMMNKTIILLLSCCCATTMTAQVISDSTDVFYKHLQLNELTVTGLTGQTRLRDMPAPVTLVTSHDLKATASTNIIDALAHKPGLAQISTGSAISKPVIRGLGYNRVLVVNDGVRQEGQQWGDEHGLELDAQGVHSVEILKGPASLMYGSDAMAGVLLLKTAPTLAKGEMQGKVSSEYQTNNGLLAYSLNLAGNRYGLVWDARYSEKHAHAYKNRYDGYVPGTQFRERAASLMIGVNRYWGHSHLSLSAFHLTPSMTEGQRNPLTGQLVEAGDYGLKTYHKTLPFQQVYHYKATWDQALHLGPGQLKTVIAYQQNRRQEFEDNPDNPELYFRLHTLSYDLRYQYAPADAQTQYAAGVGGMYQESENLAEEALVPAYRLFDVGGYLTAQHTTGPFVFSGGLRADHRHLNGLGNFRGVTGSVGAVCHVGSGVNLRLNIARGFRAPNVSELASDGVHEGTVRYEQGNAALKSEYSWQGDFGADYSGHYLSAQVSLFANRIENYIFARATGAMFTDPADGQQLQIFTYDQGDALLWGFEVEADFHPVHQLHFGNSFSMVDARQLHQSRDSRYLPMTPAPRWCSDVKFELSHHPLALSRHLQSKNGFVAVGLECYLTQNHYYRAYQTETRTPSYTLVNLSAGTDMIMGQKKILEVYLTVQNLFDRAYQNHLSRLKYTDVNVMTGRQGIFSMGRNISLKIVVPMML